MAKLFDGKKLYITLNVIMLVITALPLLFYPTAWVGFLVSCLYVSFAARSFAVILTAAIVTNLWAFLLAARLLDFRLRWASSAGWQVRLHLIVTDFFPGLSDAYLLL